MSPSLKQQQKITKIGISDLNIKLTFSFSKDDRFHDEHCNLEFTWEH